MEYVWICLDMFGLVCPIIYGPCECTFSKSTATCMFDYVIALIYSGNSHIYHQLIKLIYFNSKDSVFASVIKIFMRLFDIFIALNKSFIDCIVGNDWYNYYQSYYSYYKNFYCYLFIFVYLTM